MLDTLASMQWQDWVLGLGTWVLIWGLIPAARSRTELPPMETCRNAAVVLWVFSVTVATLGLWFASFSGAVEAALWSVVLYHKWKSNKE